VQGPTADVNGTAVPFTSGVTQHGRHACEAFYRLAIATPPTALESSPVGRERNLV